MIVQTAVDNVQVIGSTTFPIFNINRSGAGHRATLQLQGSISEDTNLTLYGRMHPDAPWSYIILQSYFVGSDGIFSIPICDQYLISISQEGTSNISVWIAN